MQRKNSKTSLRSGGNLNLSRSRGPALSDRDRSRSDRSDNSARKIEPRKNMMSTAQHSKFVLNTRTIDQRHPTNR